MVDGCLECEIFAAIEGDECLLVDVLVACLHEVGLRLEVIVLRLVELGDRRLTVLVLRLCQVEGIVGRSDCLLRSLLLRLGIQCVIVYLLDILIECLLRIVERQLLVLLTDTSRTDLVACLETVEDRHVEPKPSDLKPEVV